MLPEVQKYVDTLDAIDANVREFHVKFNESSDDDYYDNRRAWRNAERTAATRKNDAALELSENTKDALIRYVVNNYLDDYGCEVVKLLKVASEGFPAMEKMAVEAGWCGVWADAVEKAHEAGVIKLDDAERIVAKLHRELRREIGGHETEVIMKLVDELTQVRVKVALDKAAEIAENALCP